MAAGLTADALLTAVRDYAGAASSEEDSADARLLRLLNREQELRLSALLLKASGNHRMATLEYDVDDGDTTFAIPTRAIAAGLKQVEGADASGNVWMLYEFPDDQRSRDWPHNGTFYFRGNDLVFYQTPPAGTLRLTYHRRMSELVLTTSAAAITAINTGTGVVTIGVVPTTGDTFPTASTSYDFVKATPHFDIRAMDKAATRSGTSMTFAAADLPSGLAVGDYVARAGQTPICQAPLELHPVLAQLAVCKWLEMKRDPGLADARETLRELTADAKALIEPRDEFGGDDVLVNPYAPGFSRMRRYRGSTGQ